MATYFRHAKRPAWGEGRLLSDDGDRHRVLFSDGVVRTMLKGVGGLIEVEPSSEAIRAPERRSAGAGSIRAPMLIKCVRLAVRDALMSAKSTGAWPDDTLIEMQKGLSRITADHARFLATTPAVVRGTPNDGARRALNRAGPDALFNELAARLEAVPAQRWPYTRARAHATEAGA